MRTTSLAILVALVTVAIEANRHNSEFLILNS